jgi:hypothetical protein
MGGEKPKAGSGTVAQVLFEGGEASFHSILWRFDPNTESTRNPTGGVKGARSEKVVKLGSGIVILHFCVSGLQHLEWPQI